MSTKYYQECIERNGELIMKFAYVNNKYILGTTEYTEKEFIEYIQAGMLKKTLENESNLEISEHIFTNPTITSLSNITPSEYDACYELVQKTIDAYKSLNDFTAIDDFDFNVIYTLTIGTWKDSVETKKLALQKSHLPIEKQNELISLLDAVWQKTQNGDYSHRESDKPCIGMFGRPKSSYSKDDFNAEFCNSFIKTCTECIEQNDDDELFNSFEKLLNTKDKVGIQTGIVSQVLHCFKPFSFPIINGAYKKENDIFDRLGISLNEPRNQKENYIPNCRIIKKYRDENCSWKNYRVLDLMNYDFDSANNSLNEINSDYTPNFFQIIYYGVPGSGKSHKIDDKLNTAIQDKNAREEQTKRVVFHPEYTNADFVGQIMPIMDDEGVNYKFKCGTFTNILVQALKNPAKPFYLIIEEINRGNAAAIFGDIFQLLDRDSDGWSKYSIDNLDVNYEIRKTIPELNWTENTGIRLPPNLALLATMNTSDQNVFTLDNAFQRRWDMQLVENKFSDADSVQRDAKIGSTGITWETFQKRINDEISTRASNNGLSSMEDKRIGCWFIKNENGIIKADTFKNKLLKYLWDDAFKFCHEEVFGTEIKDFENLLSNVDFDKNNFGVFKTLEFSSSTQDATSTQPTDSTQAEN